MKRKKLPDVHKNVPRVEGITLNRVGVESIKFPLIVKQKDGETQNVHATFSMYGSLSSKVTGINMSRFNDELMEKWTNKSLSGKDFRELLHSLRKKVESQDVYVSASFDYFMKKKTPETKKEGVMSYECGLIGALYPHKYIFVSEVNVPVSSYCPCSKMLCLTDKRKGVGKGAHNQRGTVTIQVRTRSAHSVWLEDLIAIAESSASCEVYPLLKREDEKYVTEKGYSNPKFVEDIAREVLSKIRNLPGMYWVRVRARNYESIHPHNAVAYCEQTRRGGGRWWRSDRGFYG